MNSLDIEEPEEDEDGRGRRPPKGPPPFLKEAREEACSDVSCGGEVARMCLSRNLSTKYTGLGKRVVPRLRESLLLTPSGRGARVHAT